jgi:hypothetical protein
MKLTRRGKILIGIIIAVMAYLIATRLWWDGAGWCWGTIEKCLPMEGESK